MVHKVVTVNQIELSDKQIAQLYLNLCQDYRSLEKAGTSFTDISSILDQKVTLMLSKRPNNEHNNAYQVLSTVLAFMPAYQRAPKPVSIRQVYMIEEIRNVYHYNDCCYYHHDNMMLDWLILANLTSHHHHYHSHHHGCFSSGYNSDDTGMLILILAAIALAVSALIATYYIIKELIEIADRIYFNEGLLRAVSSIATMLALGGSGACLGYFIIGPALAGLVAATVSNPIGIIVLASVALALIGAGIGAVLFNKARVQDRVSQRMNPDAMDPIEAHRFSLTEAQQRNLENNGFDILKVKCAMAAIRQQMGDKIHSKSMRLFKHKSQQQWLDTLRALKRGDIEKLAVGDCVIDCLKPQAKTNYYCVQQGEMTLPEPSAPPMKDIALVW